MTDAEIWAEFLRREEEQGGRMNAPLADIVTEIAEAHGIAREAVRSAVVVRMTGGIG